MLLGSFTMTAQSADEVMGKHIKAVGGADAWKKITSIKKAGTVNVQGNEAKITFSQIQNKAARMDLDLDLGTGTPINNYVIFTTSEGWQFFPIGGQTAPQAMTAEQVKEAKDGLDVTDEIVALKGKGTKVEYVAKDKVDGKDAHKLKYDDEGSPVFLFFDATTGYLIKKTETVEAQGQKMEMAATFGDYKKMFDAPEQYRKLTVADIQRVAAKYLIKSQRTVGVLAAKED